MTTIPITKMIGKNKQKNDRMLRVASEWMKQVGVLFELACIRIGYRPWNPSWVNHRLLKDSL